MRSHYDSPLLAPSGSTKTVPVPAAAGVILASRSLATNHLPFSTNTKTTTTTNTNKKSTTRITPPSSTHKKPALAFTSVTRFATVNNTQRPTTTLRAPLPNPNASASANAIADSSPRLTRRYPKSNSNSTSTSAPRPAHSRPRPSPRPRPGPSALAPAPARRVSTPSSNANSSATSTSTSTSERVPLSTRQDATNKMRNLHTSRSSSSKETSTSSTSSARLPHDRSLPMASSTSRQQPQMPTLAKRSSAAPKVTPKLAGAAARPNPTPASQRQTVTLATPIPRRSAARSDGVTNQSTSGSLGANNSRREPLGINRDSFASPGPGLLQSAATPRSGSRQSRVTSANTSPNPADASADNWDARSGLSGLGISSPLPYGKNAPTSGTRDSKFFYASDASKGTQPTSQPKPPTSQPKGPTFFYANGGDIPSKAGPNSAPSAPFSPPLAATPDPASKFMYANGTPDLKPSLMRSSGSGSVVSTTSRTASGKTGNESQSPAFASSQRASSPPKPSSHAHPPSQNTSGPSIAERRSMLTSAPQLGQSNMSLRRISTENPSARTSGTSGHSRAGSLVGSVVAEPPSVTRVLAPSPPAASPLPSPLSFNNPSLSMASVLQAADELADHADPADHGDHADPDDDESMVSGLTSPKSASGNDPLNELVANARRERKVQDLQITNASLEAINRTLERQLRKQTNELRRYKRLQRAGRLSAANTASSSRIASGSTTSEAPEGPLNNLNLSDLSEEGSELDDDLESELSESDSTGSAQMSPEDMAVKDAHYRRRDEKRLQIDLSKHQQLLVDSQKMNQSLKRCLGWTEELISEGRRALAYQVRVSEVDANGRAEPEDEEQPYIYDGAQLWDHDNPNPREGGDTVDEDDQSDDSDLDDDADDTMRLRIERLRPTDEVDGTKNAQDRDSGIVLPGDAL